MDDCSPGRGGTAQNGRTRGVTFHGEIDRCRESQGWTTASSGMPKRDGKDRGEDSPTQAGSSWFARFPPDVWFVDAMTSFSDVTLVLFCFIFVFMLSLKSWPPSFNTCFFLFSFCLCGDVAFSEYCLYHFRFLFVWRVRRTFFPPKWCFKKNQSTPRPSGHPPVMGGKMSKRLGGMKGCKYKTSSWHSNRFPDADNIGSAV